MRRIIPDNPLIFQEQALIFCPHDAAAHWLHRYFNHFLEWYAPDLAGAYLALQDIGACKVNNQFTLCKIKDSNRYRRILDYQRRAVKEEFEKFRFPPPAKKQDGFSAQRFQKLPVFGAEAIGAHGNRTGLMEIEQVIESGFRFPERLDEDVCEIEAFRVLHLVMKFQQRFVATQGHPEEQCANPQKSRGGH